MVENAFWASADNLSDEYLEQMSSFFASLILNVSPNSYESRCQQLLKYVAPRAYPQVKSQWVEEGMEIKRRGMSTSFYPANFSINRKKLIVAIKGDLKVMVAGETVMVKSVTYQIQMESY